MTLKPGSKLAHYEISAQLGEGGMGEVYRADDSKLGREVAIKVLPADMSSDPERLRRFDQEARAASALNHPNILTVFDLGTEGEAPFIVMELLEGESLRARLAAGTLSVAKVIEIAVQIARGLAAAHERGIIHRDLKPENLFLTWDGHVKILDFGLAKLHPESSTASKTGGETLETATGPGVVLGTVGYMAPEQVRGEVADHRTDLFAFGAILYEMLTGQRAFRGDSSIETLNAILKDAPEDLSASGRAAPPALGRIVHRCLEKRPEDRFQSSRDLAFDLETLEKTSSSQSVGVSALGGAPAPRSRREKLWMGAAAVLGLLAAGLAAGLVITSGSPVAERAPVRFQIHPPPDALFTSPEIGGAVALSPDGRNLLFVVTRTGGATELWMRPLDEVEARQVPGTEGAQYPFWSPDSRSIGFFADGHLKRVDLLGSPPQTVCAAPSGRGGSWGSDDIIIFAAEAGGPLSRVPANGLSPPEPLTALDASRGESSHRFPAFYGEGRRFMFLAKASGPENEGVFVGSLDGDPPRLLVPGPFNAVHAPPEFVLYSREGALVARSLDDRSVELEGDQVLVAPSLTRATRSRGYASFSAARGGVLAYQPGGATGITDTHMGWVDRDGREVGTVYPPGTAFRDQALSPDGTLIAVNAEDEETGTHDLYIVDAATGHATRLTFEPTHEWLPVWSPDGQQIAYGSTQGEGAEKVCVKPSSGAGETRILFAPDQGARPNDWSADGSYIVCEVGSTAVDRDLWVLPVDGTDAGDPFPFLETEADEFMGQLSPDGKWMAYASKESGRTEIYVRPFPSGGGKWQISTEGATQPRWRADGKELYFLGLDQTVVAVPIESGRPGFRTGRSEKLFHAPLLANAVGTDEYVPSSDGQRFLIAYSIEEAGLSTPITVVLDWQEALKRAR